MELFETLGEALNPNTNIEITDEIKAKIFAQHLGRMIELDNFGSKVRNRKLIAVGGIDDLEYLKLRLGEAGKNQYTHVVPIKHNACKIILKSLENITEEDAIEVGKILISPHAVYHVSKEDWLIKNTKYWIENGLVAVYSSNSYQNFSAFQYLQSKGYDLPQYLLGGKTLHEAGLAIYE